MLSMCLIILTGYKMDRMSSTAVILLFGDCFLLTLKPPNEKKKAKTIDIKLILVMIALWAKTWTQKYWKLLEILA